MCNIDDEEVYEGYVEDEVSEMEGITDKVTNYTYTKLEYPCLLFRKGVQLEKHKVQVVSNMVNSKTLGSSKDISLYLSNNGELFKIGKISGVQVLPLLEIIGEENLQGFLDKDTELKGSLIYTLCSV